MSRYSDLFLSFFKIGLFTFGGGYAMIPIIQNEVIRRRGWIEERDFLDLLTLAQSAPGPISLNTSVFVGYKLRGYRGAATALAGVVLPAFTVILLVAVFFASVRHNELVDAAFKGMRPAVVALIVAPIAGFVKGMRPALIAVAAAVAVAVWRFGLSPVWLLAAGAAAGAAWAALRGQDLRRGEEAAPKKKFRHEDGPADGTGGGTGADKSERPDNRKRSGGREEARR